MLSNDTETSWPLNGVHDRSQPYD